MQTLSQEPSGLCYVFRKSSIHGNKYILCCWDVLQLLRFLFSTTRRGERGQDINNGERVFSSSSFLKQIQILQKEKKHPAPCKSVGAANIGHWLLLFSPHLVAVKIALKEAVRKKKGCSSEVVMLLRAHRCIADRQAKVKVSFFLKLSSMLRIRRDETADDAIKKRKDHVTPLSLSYDHLKGQNIECIILYTL